MKNIVLVGFMGSGKSSVARELSERLQMKYISTDDVVEQKEGRSINDIFKDSGESYFRNLEKNIIKDISDKTGQVIDTGGGIVLQEINIENLKKTGVIFCLSVTPEEVWRRVENSDHRPLLKVDDPLGKIKELMGIRQPFYAKADHSIMTDGMTTKEVANKIIELYKNA